LTAAGKTAYALVMPTAGFLSPGDLTAAGTPPGTIRLVAWGREVEIEYVRVYLH